MNGNQGAELSARERRFVRAALWKSSYRLGVLSMCLLATCASTTLVAVTDLGPRSSGGLVTIAVTSGVLLLACGALMMRDRRRRMPDALVAINRCGCCGHCLKGATKIESRGVDVRTCCECGRNWTNLDRRISINQIYQCA
ncbi:MAG: hypothetical protein VX641_00685 [Planctomycetota bacterium]|nr:hypothetical protein [Planctomycetota bacterium]